MELEKEIKEFNKILSEKDKKLSECFKVLDQKGKLKNLKQTYIAFKEKSDQFYELRGYVDRYDHLESYKQEKKTEKETELLKFQSKISEHKDIITDFEKDTLDIHEFIQGNRSASFQLKSVNNKSVVEIVMRIDSDGGHSINREKVFIYDIALLLNKYTKQRHPGFLVHDNIFDVDQDTLNKNIKYLLGKANLEDQQYILTINSDRLEENMKEDLEHYTKASFTRNNRFLKQSYQEKLK